MCEEKKAVILAHYYTDGCIQDVADFVGDSLALAQKAAKTDAEFYRANNTSKLREVYKQIDTLEKTKMNVKKYSKRYEAFFPFMLFSVIFLFMDILLRKTLLKRIP